MNRICIVGAGVFGSALAKILLENPNNELGLWSIENDVVADININHKNSKYCNNTKFDNVNAFTDLDKLSDYDYHILALPSGVIVNFVEDNIKYLASSKMIINVAKGFGKNKETIFESLTKISNNKVCVLKGPTFAQELLSLLPSSLTFASKDSDDFKIISSIFENTVIKLDYNLDVIGVEYVSILKNIYAIVIGIADAFYNSANVKYSILTKAFNEINLILNSLEACNSALFNYCGIGDLCLTSLNDLSRNRTLGLLIGKGFYNPENENNVTLEGLRSVKIFYDKLMLSENIHFDKLVLLQSLNAYFSKEITLSTFMSNIMDRGGYV